MTDLVEMPNLTRNQQTMLAIRVAAANGIRILSSEEAAKHPGFGIDSGQAMR